MITFMEAKDWHLPVTPFHGGLQKIKIFAQPI
jgi:hypothetical protein